MIAEINAAEVDNALVAQKDEILKRVRITTLHATQLLRFAAPLWRACNYGYKVEEVKERILAEANFQLEHTNNHQKNQRAELEFIIKLAREI